MRTIEEILGGRELIMANDVLECFVAKTGRSISLNTLAAMRAMDSDSAWAIQPPGQRYWLYDWGLLWAWYRTYSQRKSARRRKIS